MRYKPGLLAKVDHIAFLRSIPINPEVWRHQLLGAPVFWSDWQIAVNFGKRVLGGQKT